MVDKHIRTLLTFFIRSCGTSIALRRFWPLERSWKRDCNDRIQTAACLKCLGFDEGVHIVKTGGGEVVFGNAEILTHQILDPSDHR